MEKTRINSFGEGANARGSSLILQSSYDDREPRYRPSRADVWKSSSGIMYGLRCPTAKGIIIYGIIFG